VIAGVCGGLGRATNTDPVAWRVLLGALVLFGAIGHWSVAMLAVLAYAVGWLVLPEEGEQHSALEALFGRGTSSVSRGLTVVLLGAAVIALLGVLDNAAIPIFLLSVAGVAVVYQLARSGTLGNRPFASPIVRTPAPAPQAAAYSPPFAPHGPYADPAGTQWTPPPVPPAPPEPPKPRKPPRPPRERSALGRLTFSVALLALGGLAIADLLGTDVPAGAYFAVALAVAALGLLVGSFVGRARGLIVWGLLLSIALGIAVAAERIDLRSEATGERNWRPVTVEAIQPRYDHGVGLVVLDLRGVPFTDATNVSTRIESGVGEVQVLLPPNVDVTADGVVRLGDVQLLDRYGRNPGTRLQVEDSGPDGPGGGRLDLSVELGVGKVEVSREAA
jgi:phage shock protein PspC (stress-responsive transcriptional regulator)/predicted membrane protein